MKPGTLEQDCCDLTGVPVFFLADTFALRKGVFAVDQAIQCKISRLQGLVRELIREICREHEVTIMKGHMGGDHAPLTVSIPPQVTISRLVQWLKGKTSRMLLGEFAHLRKGFWGRHVRARGYFCCSSGNVTDEVIKEYIAGQIEDADDDFKVEGGT